jgi:arylsulfatase A-like enzyme
MRSTTRLTTGIHSLICTFLPVTLLHGGNKDESTNIRQPNVLFIVVDDWGAQDLSFAGSRFYETPNIDRLAGQSTSFSNAYVAYPRSVPSRYSLWTGMHCARPQGLKGTEADERKIDKNTLAIAEPFKAAGYATFFIGKWHLATDDCLPQHKGFEINIGGGHAGATSSHFAPFNQNYKDNSRGEGGLIEGMDDAAPGEYLTDYMTRKTVEYIKTKRDKPFLAVVSFYAVHTPIQAKKEMIAKYQAKKISLGLTEDRYIPEEAGERKAQQNNAVYAAMVESVDQGVGKLVDALKESGQYDNTLIVIVSDNGGLSNRGAGNKRELATNNDPYKAGKGHLYEGGIKTPLLIHLPAQTNAGKSDVLTAGYDLFPTVAQLCDVKVDKKLDGRSLAPVLNGNSKVFAKRELYWHKSAERPASTGDYVSTAIRMGNYKLIDFYEQDRIELYDLSKDVSESTNIAAKKPKITRRMLAKVQNWRNEMNVNMPKKNNKKNK